MNLMNNQVNVNNSNRFVPAQGPANKTQPNHTSPARFAEGGNDTPAFMSQDKMFGPHNLSGGFDLS